MERTLARRSSGWQEAGGVLALATAIGLWIAVVFAVAAPLGETLARIDAPAPAATRLACATPAE